MAKRARTAFHVLKAFERKEDMASSRGKRVRETSDGAYVSQAGTTKAVAGAPRAKMGRTARALSSILMNPQTLIWEYDHSANYLPTAISGTTIAGKCSYFSWTTMTPQVATECLKTMLNQSVMNSIPSDCECVVESAHSTLTMTNNYNMKVQVTVFELWPRYDIPYDPVRQNMVATHIFPEPGVLATSTPPVADPAADRTAVDQRDYGFSPFMSDVVPKMWRIKQHSNKYLTPGESFVIKHRAPQQRLSKARFGLISSSVDTVESQWEYVRDFGSVLLVRVQGTTVHSSSLSTDVGLNDTPLNAVPGAFNLDVVAKRNVTVNMIVRGRTRKIGYVTSAGSGAVIFKNVAVNRSNAEQYQEQDRGDPIGADP